MKMTVEWKRLTSILVLLGHCFSVHGVIQLADLLPLGPAHGDSTLPTGSDAFIDVSLQQSIPFLGIARSTISVSSQFVLFLMCNCPEIGRDFVLFFL